MMKMTLKIDGDDSDARISAFVSPSGACISAAQLGYELVIEPNRDQTRNIVSGLADFAGFTIVEANTLTETTDAPKQSNDELRAENKHLETLLKPFAEIWHDIKDAADWEDDDGIGDLLLAGDLRQAAKAVEDPQIHDTATVTTTPTQRRQEGEGNGHV